MKSFKWLWCDIMTFWVNKVTTEEVLESYMSKILETLQKQLDDWCPIQTNFFYNENWFDRLSKVTSNSVTISKLQKFWHIKESGIKLEPGFKFKNLSLVNQQWPKHSFFIKGRWFGGVWKVSNDCHAISWLSESTKLLQSRSLKAIKVKSCRLCKGT